MPQDLRERDGSTAGHGTVLLVGEAALAARRGLPVDRLVAALAVFLPPMTTRRFEPH